MTVQAAVAPDSLAIANRLRPVLLHLNRHLRREVHLLGVSGSQISLLSAIQDRPGIGVADLAAREGTAASSVCVHIDRLEASGLVTRQRDAAVDRRRVGLSVTGEGERVLRAVRRRRTAWLASRLDGLDTQQRAVISQAVDALAALVAQP